ncbi:peptidoglycan DD-metalloendopeptidase family protein [Methylomonas sp. MgM2]
MAARWPILLLLALASSNASAKKLYKYQDGQGRWHFSDKAPVSDQEVEVRQLKPAPKQRVRLEKHGDQQQLFFYAVNQYPGPIEIEVDWEKHENAIADPPLPQRFVVGEGKSADLFNIRGAANNQSWRFTLQYQYMIGQPLSGYHGSQPYLPPIAPGSRFQLTQAFGGKFSHQDEQNRYAVDIMMPVGTPVHAARGGIVLEVDDDYFKSGTEKAYANKANSIRILHDDGSMAVYAHLELERAQAHSGLRVQAGELIAYSGNTGFTTGPHLHFAVQVNQDMRLVSVPFRFVGTDGRVFEPQQGAWLEGINPGFRYR